MAATVEQAIREGIPEDIEPAIPARLFRRPGAVARAVAGPEARLGGVERRAGLAHRG